MTKAPVFFRLDNYYHNLRILKVQDLHQLELAKFMHSHFNHYLSQLTMYVALAAQNMVTMSHLPGSKIYQIPWSENLE